jgi:hypothetical protein
MTAIALTMNFAGLVNTPIGFEKLRAANPQLYIEPIGSAHVILISKSEIESGGEILLCDTRSWSERNLNPLPANWMPNPSLI